MFVFVITISQKNIPSIFDFPWSNSADSARWDMQNAFLVGTIITKGIKMCWLDAHLLKHLEQKNVVILHAYKLFLPVTKMLSVIKWQKLCPHFFLASERYNTPQILALIYVLAFNLWPKLFFVLMISTRENGINVKKFTKKL